MFYLFLTLATTIVVMQAIRGGPRAAMAASLPLVVALPFWSYREVGAIRIDVRTATACLAIGCVAFHPRTTFRYRPLFADLLILGLIAVQIATEAITAIVTLTVVVEILLQWGLPYLFGRMLWTSNEQGRDLLPGVVVACLFLGAWAVFESVFRVNPIASICGHGSSVQSLYDLRMGMRRAEGPLTHPIFFGLMMVLLFPFALAAHRRAQDDDAPSWWSWTPWITAAGAFASLSRGPQLGIPATLLVVVVLLSRRLRWPILVPAILGVVVAASSFDVVVELLERWAGETTKMHIVLNGESLPYSGTNHRFLQLRVYAEAVENAGWLGYGTSALRADGTRIPFIQEDLRQMFASVDNHYLQFVLQCGFVGLGLFLSLLITAIYYAASAVVGAAGELRTFSAATAGALLTLTVMLFSVWLSGDYRSVLLTSIGLSGGLRLSRSAESHSVEKANTSSPDRVTDLGEPPIGLRLTPGYSVHSIV